MNKLKLFMLTVMTLLYSMSVCAQTFRVNEISYNVLDASEKTVEVARDEQYDGDITIPSTVEYEGGSYSVVKIGYKAFYNTRIESVRFSDSLTEIGNEAFKYCTDLSNISFSSYNLQHIGDNAFEGCSDMSFRYLDLPEGLLSIGKEAFQNCENLYQVTCPNSLTTVGESAFSGCDRLVHVYLPENLSIIPDYMFSACPDLSFCSLPTNLRSIGKGAFMNCDDYVLGSLPETLTDIEDNAFGGCSSLTSVVIPNSVTSIGSQAFKGCSRLTSIEIGNSVASIGKYAFEGCDKLNSITVLNPTPPTTIEAFSNYDATLYVPYGAKTAYSEAEYWKNFTSIEELEPPIYELKDGVVYDQQTDTLVNAVTYTRTLPNLYWNALYVPFKLPYDVIADRYDVAYINDVNGYDTDDNGTIDDLAMEIIKIKGGTLKANYPYLIKAKTAADKAMSITVENATLYAAEENSVDCSSVYQNYAVTGIYTKKTAEELAGKLAISTSGAWQPLAAGTALNPFRLYLSIENRDNSPLEVEASAMSRMRIVERGETTGVGTITPAQQREDVIIDLSGRRVKQPVKGGVYIINGKKRIF